MIVKIFFLSFSLFLIFTSGVLAEKVKVGDFNFPEVGIKVEGVSFTPDASKFFFSHLDLEVDTARRKLPILRNFLDNLPSGNVIFKNLLIKKQKECWEAEAEEFSFSSKEDRPIKIKYTKVSSAIVTKKLIIALRSLLSTSMTQSFCIQIIYKSKAKILHNLT
ncbi:hypothetical protein, partial [Desulfurobacterium sp.]|uniref:hypothetical protein n=1 Tax=Desulfurobacterium sp. TaxID=2004706 RepID=UPI002635E1D1